MFFFFEQNTAYEFSGCDWNSDVCSSDLKIHKNIEDCRNRGFNGHILARMACSMKTSIFEDVQYLMNCDLKFDAVYWQLDTQWDFPMNVRWGDFEGFLRDRKSVV